MIVEPVAGNMGVVPPAAGFLAGLRDLCTRHGALLIFDEVITGFRVAYGGAQERYGVRPDLTCLGKIIGGGLPVGAYGGRADLMRHVAPLGRRVPGGHAVGKPARRGRRPGHPARAARGSRRLRSAGAARRPARRRDSAAPPTRPGVPVAVNRVGSMLTGFFTDGPVRNYADARRADTARYGRFFHGMLDARRVSGAVPVRGRLRLAGPHPGRPRPGRARRGGEPLASSARA